MSTNNVYTAVSSSGERLYIDNDVPMILTGLTDKYSSTPLASITDAVVTVTGYDSDNAQIAGVNWPVVCAYDSEQDHYIGILPSDAVLTEGGSYSFKFVVSVTGGRDGQFTRTLVAEVRR